MTRLFAMFGVSLVGWTAAIAASPWPAGAYQNPIGVGSHAKDPSVLVAAGAYHLFTSYTGDPALIGNVPLQRATDLVSWQYLGDALPVLPAWVDPADPQVGGPATLIRPSLGRYLLYFSARHRDDGSPQAGWRCIGVVASASPTMLLGGSPSLIPADEPIVCNDDADAFDPSVFTFPNPNGDPHAWLVWVERRFGQPDVILHRLLAADGSDVLAPVPALPLLTAGTYIDEWELGMLANPSVVHDPGANKTYLFYSANDPVYSVDDPTVTVVIGQGGLRPTHYGTNWAVCQPTPYGVFLPCARNERAPWLRSQNGAARPGDAAVTAGQQIWLRSAQAGIKNPALTITAVATQPGGVVYLYVPPRSGPCGPDDHSGRPADGADRREQTVAFLDIGAVHDHEDHHRCRRRVSRDRSRSRSSAPCRTRSDPAVHDPRRRHRSTVTTVVTGITAPARCTVTETTSGDHEEVDVYAEPTAAASRQRRAGALALRATQQLSVCPAPAQPLSASRWGASRPSPGVNFENHVEPTTTTRLRLRPHHEHSDHPTTVSTRPRRRQRPPPAHHRRRRQRPDHHAAPTATTTADDDAHHGRDDHRRDHHRRDRRPLPWCRRPRRRTNASSPGTRRRPRRHDRPRDAAGNGIVRTPDPSSSA